MPKGVKTETVFHNFSAQKMPTIAEQGLIATATEAAKDVKHSNPYQSDYYVQAAVVGPNGEIALGANREKTHSDASIHGETGGVYNYKTLYGDTAIKAICFWTKVTDPNILKNTSPCGPCRDTLKQEISPDTLITVGNDKVIAVQRFSDYLKDTFRAVNIGGVNPLAVQSAAYALELGTTEYLPELMLGEVYGVSLLDRHNNTWRGGLHTTSGYNEVSPGYNAVTTWRDTLEPGEKRTDIDRITIVRQGALPTNVEYRDRQALLEFDETLMKKFGRTAHIWVDLVNIDENGIPQEVARTDTLEWLPNPFSATVLGLQAPEQQAEKLRRFAEMER